MLVASETSAFFLFLLPSFHKSSHQRNPRHLYICDPAYTLSFAILHTSLGGIAHLNEVWSGAIVRIYWSVSTTNLYIHPLAPNPSSQLPLLFPVSITRWTPIPSRPNKQKGKGAWREGGFFCINKPPASPITPPHSSPDRRLNTISADANTAKSHSAVAAAAASATFALLDRENSRHRPRQKSNSPLKISGSTPTTTFSAKSGRPIWVKTRRSVS